MGSATEKARKISPDELPPGLPERAMPKPARLASERKIASDRGASVAKMTMMEPLSFLAKPPGMACPTGTPSTDSQ